MTNRNHLPADGLLRAPELVVTDFKAGDMVRYVPYHAVRMSVHNNSSPDDRFKRYQRRGFIEARPYISGEDLNGISVSPADQRRPQGLDGGMIARNPNNYDDQWYIAPSFFYEHYE